MDGHTLRGSLSVSDAAEAEDRARAAAAAYFGDRPFCLSLSVSEVRTHGDDVVGYLVDYTADLDRRDEWVPAAPR